MSEQGPMDTGPDAGAGPGGPEDVDMRMGLAGEERGPEGPAGPMDSSVGDLDESGA